MIDLHSHVLPAVDDGAADLEEALAMCRRAAEDGCHTLFATPHQRNELWENRTPRRLAALVEELRQRLAGTLRLELGAEIRIDSELLDELDDLPASGLLPLGDSRWLLLEFPHRGIEGDPVALTHELVVAGWRPIYAHPELIRGLGQDLDLVHRLVAQGATFQLTAMSVSGDFGPRPREICQRMIDHGLAHFVASDAHGIERRPPGLGAARQAIRERWGDEVAARLTHDNAAAVLADEPLPRLEEAPV